LMMIVTQFLSDSSCNEGEGVIYLRERLTTGTVN